MTQSLTGRPALSLAGEWRYRLDPNFLGEMRGWYEGELTQSAAIFLPNTLDTAEEGPRNASFEPGKPTRKRKFEGCAWFQKAVVIPPEWAGRRVVLFFERCSRSSRVWVDGVSAGLRDSISAPHRYDLTALLPPGEHLLTVEVENAYARSYGAGVFIGRWSSAICDDLQTNWLGLIGRLELTAEPPAALARCNLLPSLTRRTVLLRAEVRNDTGLPLSGKVSAVVRDAAGNEFARAEAAFESAEPQFTVPLEIGMAGAVPWDENSGALYTAEAELCARAGMNSYRDARTERFGYREFTKRGTQFVLNGDTVFLRGTVEYTGFPQTGHPPMEDRAAWEKRFRACREYGVNHIRFHSCCPPELAFQVADELGLLLHVEVPVWPEKPGSGEQAELLDFIEREAKRIIAAYCNHPSFVMLGLGNEHQSHFDVLDRIIRSLKAYCPDKLYTFSTNFVCDGPTPESDYFISSRTASGSLRIDSGDRAARFQGYSDGTGHDYRASVRDVSVPVIAHELGQWTTYPDFSYLKKYRDTIFDPRSSRELSEELERGGLAGRDREFQRASGSFSWLLYKEEIETALRTPGMGGFELLSLADSPGWGEAFTGALDPFWDPKGFLAGREMRRFCGDVVPLLRMGRFVYSDADVFRAAVQIANYSRTSLPHAVVDWELASRRGTVADGSFEDVLLEKGGLRDAGALAVPLAGLTEPEQLRVTVRIRGTDFQNDWHIWVYPQAEPAPPSAVHICRALDEDCRRRLDAGEDVLYLADPKDCRMRYMRFLPVFWSLWWFWWSWRDQEHRPATMGVLCDPAHPLFELFPTDAHSDFQWWDVLEKENAFTLSNEDKTPDVLLRVIDDYHINRPLAAIVQARVGRGRLLACSLDLARDGERRPAARQLARSILHYMAGGRFAPKCACTFGEFRRAIRSREA